jgi:hypothetical protein
MALDELRARAIALPGTEEATHFNLPSFKVDGKSFITVMRDGTHVIVSAGRAEAEAASAEHPDVYEAVWRNNGKIFVGLRFSLVKVRAERLQHWIEAGWRQKASKARLAAFDAHSSDRSPQARTSKKRTIPGRPRSSRR